MKSFTIILSVLAAVASAGKVDECAVCTVQSCVRIGIDRKEQGSCISKAIEATGCASSDPLCICSSNSFIESVESCGPCAEDGSNGERLYARFLRIFADHDPSSCCRSRARLLRDCSALEPQAIMGVGRTLVRMVAEGVAQGALGVQGPRALQASAQAST
jgi:hypothetical protein